MASRKHKTARTKKSSRRTKHTPLNERREIERARKQARTLLLPMNDENLEKLRTVLKRIYDKIKSVMDVMVVISNALEESDTEHNEEMGRVLRRHACNPLYGETVELRFTIKQLGGRELFALSDDEGNDEIDEEERNSTDRSFS